jgi:hypothetical protein
MKGLPAALIALTGCATSQVSAFIEALATRLADREVIDEGANGAP